MCGWRTTNRHSRTKHDRFQARYGVAAWLKCGPPKRINQCNGGRSGGFVVRQYVDCSAPDSNTAWLSFRLVCNPVSFESNEYDLADTPPAKSNHVCLTSSADYSIIISPRCLFSKIWRSRDVLLRSRGSDYTGFVSLFLLCDPTGSSPVTARQHKLASVQRRISGSSRL